MLISLVDGFLNEQIGWIIALLILSLKYEWKFFDVYLHKIECLLFDLLSIFLLRIILYPCSLCFWKNYRDRSLQFCCSSHNFQLPSKKLGRQTVLRWNCNISIFASCHVSCVKACSYCLTLLLGKNMHRDVKLTFLIALLYLYPCSPLTFVCVIKFLTWDVCWFLLWWAGTEQGLQTGQWTVGLIVPSMFFCSLAETMYFNMSTIPFSF